MQLLPGCLFVGSFLAASHFHSLNGGLISRQVAGDDALVTHGGTGAVSNSCRALEQDKKQHIYSQSCV